MARNGTGTYSLVAGNPVVTGTAISSTWANNTLTDIATALTQSISQDGQTPVTANLPMGGFKLTGLAAGSTAGDSVRYEQFASPPAIGSTTPTTGAFTQITSTVATGTAPMVVASTTEVANLHAATATAATTSAAVTNGGALNTPASGNLANCTFPTLNQNTTGTSAGLSTTLAIASGGTGTTTAALAFIALAGSQTTGVSGNINLGAIKIEWGVTGSIVTNTTSTVIFSVGFPTACNHVFLTPSTLINNNQAIGFSATSLTTTDFAVKQYSTDASSVTFRYLAIGY